MFVSKYFPPWDSKEEGSSVLLSCTRAVFSGVEAGGFAESGDLFTGTSETSEEDAETVRTSLRLVLLSGC